MGQIDAKSVTLYKNAKNILVLKFESEDDRAHFLTEEYKAVGYHLRHFMEDDSQNVTVIALIPGQELTVLKIDPEEAEIVDETQPAADGA